MSEMERRAAAMALKQLGESVDETRGMVAAITAVLASLPEFKTLDLAKAKELSRQISRGTPGRGQDKLFTLLNELQQRLPQ